MDLSGTQQDYIKTVWRLEENFQAAKMKTVADEVGVKPPTVSSMFGQLQNLELITYDRKNGARLTQSGKLEAKKIIRNHRLIETFLQKVLKVDEPLLHIEAEKLEHVVSDQIIRKIDEFLGYPDKDPHGSTIPSLLDGDIEYSLSEVDRDIMFRIVSIPGSAQSNQYCQKNALLPGTNWVIKQIDPHGESFLVSDGETYLALSAQLARKIKVAMAHD